MAHLPKRLSTPAVFESLISTPVLEDKSIGVFMMFVMKLCGEVDGGRLLYTILSIEYFSMSCA